MIEMMYVEEKTYIRIIGDKGKSLYVTIPFPIVLLQKLKKGDELEINLVDDKIVMEKKKGDSTIRSSNNPSRIPKGFKEKK